MVAFDKTGTLTKGSTEVTDFLYCANPSAPLTTPTTVPVDSLYDTFEPLNIPALLTGSVVADFSEARYLLQLMLLAECRSSHPLAKGITAFCKAQLAQLDSGTTLSNSSVLPAEEDLLFDVVPGLGIHMHTTDTTTTTSTTNVNTSHTSSVSTSVLVGSGKLLQSMNVAISPAAERTASSYRAGGKVAVFMAVNGRLRAIVGKCCFFFIAIRKFIAENTEYKFCFNVNIFMLSNHSYNLFSISPSSDTLGVSDAVRPEAAHVFRSLHSQGIACYMITGDEATTAHVCTLPLFHLQCCVTLLIVCH